jgi:thymidine kinase
MLSLIGLKAKAAAFGAAALVVLGFLLRLKIVTAQRDRAIVVAETLKARHHVVKVQAKIKREEEKKLISRKADIIKQLEKSDEEFDGVDNLTDSNKF